MKIFDRLVRPRPSAANEPTSYRIKGVKLDIVDGEMSIAPAVVREIRRDVYGFDAVRFAPGDIVIDIGAHIGIVSLYLAKKYPFLTIYAYEPTPANFRRLVANVAANGATNVTATNLAVTSDRRDLEMIVSLDNTGGATSNLADMTLAGHEHYVASSITLDDVFERHGIARCKVLKIDCEGSEHEILRGTKKLDRIEWIVGEFHINRHLESQGYTIENLVRLLEASVPRERIRFETCRMAE